jgi:hypothetical protein
MSLADAFKGLQAAEQVTPRDEVVPAPATASSSKERKEVGRSPEPVRRGRDAPVRPSPRPRAAVAAPSRLIALDGTAKSRHPEYEGAKIYVRKSTKKQAWRKWEDEDGGDFSDLVQHLLEEYLGT